MFIICNSRVFWKEGSGAMWIGTFLPYYPLIINYMESTVV